MKIFFLLLSMLFLAACTSGSGSLGDPDVALTEALNTIQVTEAYRKAVQPNPNYTIPQTFPSTGYPGNGNVTLGADVSPRERLPLVASSSGFNYYLGASRDGAGINRLENYARDLVTKNGTVSVYRSHDGLFPFRVAPVLQLKREFWEAINWQRDPEAQVAWDIILAAAEILNDALPPEFQITTASGARGIEDEGAITVHMLSESDMTSTCGASALACAVSYRQPKRFSFLNDDVTRAGHTTYAKVYFEAGSLTTDKWQTSLTLAVHELLHAMGIGGHVDSIEFPDSLMGTYGEFFPNPGYILHRIDREALQVMYFSQRTARYNDWGEWTDTTLHLMGQSQDETVRFGVALFNGLPQPWATGPIPDGLMLNPSTLQRDAQVLPGTFGIASWRGGLLGFSGVSPIGGDVALHVDLDNLTDPHDLEFRDLYFLNRWEDQTDARWFSTRNIDYDVELWNNWFTHVSEDGRVTGTFVGEEHDGMVGTLHRTDLIGAFGGTR